jgi:hypothetical protein
MAGAFLVVGALLSEVALYAGIAWRHRNEWSVADVLSSTCRGLQKGRR